MLMESIVDFRNCAICSLSATFSTLYVPASFAALKSFRFEFAESLTDLMSLNSSLTLYSGIVLNFAQVVELKKEATNLLSKNSLFNASTSFCLTKAALISFKEL